LRIADYEGETWIHLHLRLPERIPNPLDARGEWKDTSFLRRFAANPTRNLIDSKDKFLLNFLVSLRQDRESNLLVRDLQAKADI
jgi:hypothetical protein